MYDLYTVGGCNCPDSAEPFSGPHVAHYLPTVGEQEMLGGLALPWAIAAEDMAHFYPLGVEPYFMGDVASPQIGAIRPRMVTAGNTR